ncbi:MAG TPA: hypothetical protein VH518_25645 [Tepidisphaeraceae bacterium]|jgi:hypothetical protein
MEIKQEPIVLTYATPEPRQSRWRYIGQAALGLIDFLDRRRSLLLVLALFAILLGARQANWIGATAIISGSALLEFVIVSWLTRS